MLGLVLALGFAYAQARTRLRIPFFVWLTDSYCLAYGLAYALNGARTGEGQCPRFWPYLAGASA